MVLASSLDTPTQFTCPAFHSSHHTNRQFKFRLKVFVGEMNDIKGPSGQIF